MKLPHSEAGPSVTKKVEGFDRGSGGGDRGWGGSKRTHLLRRGWEKNSQNKKKREKAEKTDLSWRMKAVITPIRADKKRGPKERNRVPKTTSVGKNEGQAGQYQGKRKRNNNR